MKIDKAIAVLSEDLTYSYPTKFNELTDAHQLGIEALKRLKKCRHAGYKFYCQLMPGETAE